jgi:uncharacterized RDD family membrane protein YckC
MYKGHETARMADMDGTPLASFWSRFWAFMIDFMLAALTFVLVAVGVALLFEKLGWMSEGATIYFDPFNHEHWQSLAYFVVFVAASNYIGNGATIGKRIMKIRAVSLVHERLSLWHSIERALGYGASALEAFFGFFQYFIHPNRRTVHDRIAETIVVSERRAAAKVDSLRE